MRRHTLIHTQLRTGFTLHLRVATYDDSPTCTGAPPRHRHRVMTEGNRSLTQSGHHPAHLIPIPHLGVGLTSVI